LDHKSLGHIACHGPGAQTLVVHPGMTFDHRHGIHQRRREGLPFFWTIGAVGPRACIWAWCID
jgi:hypothetical protein